jgi:hypothetical protein
MNDVVEEFGKNKVRMSVSKDSFGGSTNCEVVVWRRGGGRRAWRTSSDAVVSVNDQRPFPMGQKLDTWGNL